jgi:hypothetical protein
MNNKPINISACMAIVLITLGFVFKVNHWPGAGPTMVLGNVVLSFFFLPAFAIYKSRDIQGKGLRRFTFVAFLCLAPIQLSILFKIMHWPFATLLLLIPVLIFSVVLIPGLCFFKMKAAQTRNEKLMYLSGLSSLPLFALGYCFKMQHYPGAMFIFGGGALMLCAVFLPFYMRSRRNERKDRTEGLVQLCFAVVIISLMLVAALNTTSSAVLYSFVIVEDNIRESTDNLVIKNKELYSAIPGSSGDAVITTCEAQKAKVKDLSNSLFQYVEDLKSEIKASASGFSKAVADSTPLADIGPKDNFDAPAGILIGSDLENLRDGKFSARELKNRISVYKMDLLSMVKEEALKHRMSATIGLSTVDRNDPNTDFVSWEINNFNRVPLAATITLLSQIQYNVRYAESEMLRYLRNSASTVISEIPSDSRVTGKADPVTRVPLKIN